MADLEDKNSNLVYINNDLTLNGVKIRQYEVGFVKERKNNTLSVYFIASDITLELDKKQVTFFDPLKTGDGFERKVCNICHRLLPTSEFQKNQNGKNNRTVRRPSCTECRKNLDGKPLSAKTKAVWQQNEPYLVPFTCPICHKRTIPGLTSKVVLDHNHETGEARGWICDSCNTGIGRFKDDPALLQSAIEYLNQADCDSAE
jgi:hypothetical protein